MLADKFEDMGTDKLTRAEVKRLLKTRLRTCWWGPRANLNVKLDGKEVGNYTDGKGEKFSNELTDAESAKAVAAAEMVTRRKSIT